MQKQRRQWLHDDDKACFLNAFFGSTKQWSLRRFLEVFRRSGAEPSRLVLHSTLHLQALFNFLGLFHWCRLPRRTSRVGVEQACVLSRGCAPVCQSHC